MVAEKKIPYEEITDETRDLIEQATDQPIVVEFNGKRFRIVREYEEADAVRPTQNNKKRDDLWKNYDPEKVREAMHGLIGTFKGIDVEELKREIREQRGQYSVGRPYDPE
ncbi:hypothetical protein BH09CHL1_BH09CHL1_20870 [soil metagenome]